MGGFVCPGAQQRASTTARHRSSYFPEANPPTTATLQPTSNPQDVDPLARSLHEADPAYVLHLLLKICHSVPGAGDIVRKELRLDLQDKKQEVHIKQEVESDEDGENTLIRSEARTQDLEGIPNGVAMDDPLFKKAKPTCQPCQRCGHECSTAAFSNHFARCIRHPGKILGHREAETEQHRGILNNRKRSASDISIIDKKPRFNIEKDEESNREMLPLNPHAPAVTSIIEAYKIAIQEKGLPFNTYTKPQCQVSYKRAWDSTCMPFRLGWRKYRSTAINDTEAKKIAKGASAKAIKDFGGMLQVMRVAIQNDIENSAKHGIDFQDYIAQSQTPGRREVMHVPELYTKSAWTASVKRARQSIFRSFYYEWKNLVAAGMDEAEAKRKAKKDANAKMLELGTEAIHAQAKRLDLEQAAEARESQELEEEQLSSENEGSSKKDMVETSLHGFSRFIKGLYPNIQ